MRDISVQLIDKLEEKIQAINEAIDLVKHDNHYSDVYKEAEIKRLYSQIEPLKNSTWEEIEKTMDGRVKEAEDRLKLKASSPGHQQMVSNALKMVELVGENMTADQMNNIMAPFVEAEDYQTLSILKTYTDTKLPENARSGVEFPDLKTSEVKRHTDMKNLYGQMFNMSTERFLGNGMGRAIALATVGQANGYITRD